MQCRCTRNWVSQVRWVDVKGWGGVLARMWGTALRDVLLGPKGVVRCMQVAVPPVMGLRFHGVGAQLQRLTCTSVARTHLWH